MNDEEKAAAAKVTLMEVAGSEELVDWILGNKDSILGAYEAGVEKRVINPKAQEALAAYRAQKAKEKEAAAGGAPAAPTATATDGGQTEAG